MFKKILAVIAAACIAATTPVMAQMEPHQNPSLNGYVGQATDTQYARPAAFRTAPGSLHLGAAGSGNPSLESFTPNAVSQPPARFQTTPGLVENPAFDWIARADVGA